MDELRAEHRQELKKMEKLLEAKNAQKEKLEWGVLKNIKSILIGMI